MQKSMGGAVNESNLIPVRTKSEARERGRNGGIKSGRARRLKKTMREELQELLKTKIDGESTASEAISLALIDKALSGDVHAYEVIRDTVGEKPGAEQRPQESMELIVRWQKS